MSLFTVRVSMHGLTRHEIRRMEAVITGFGMIYTRSIYFPPNSTKEPPSAKLYSLSIDSNESATDWKQRLEARFAEVLSTPVDVIVKKYDDELGLETMTREEMQHDLVNGLAFPSLYDLTYGEIEWISTWQGANGEPGGPFHNPFIISHYNLQVEQGENTWAQVSDKMRARKASIEMGDEQRSGPV